MTVKATRRPGIPTPSGRGGNRGDLPSRLVTRRAARYVSCTPRNNSSTDATSRLRTACTQFFHHDRVERIIDAPEDAAAVHCNFPLRDVEEDVLQTRAGAAGVAELDHAIAGPAPGGEQIGAGFLGAVYPRRVRCFLPVK